MFAPGSFESISKMMEVSYNAHFNQKRKWSGEPYFCHPLRVRHIVESVIENLDKHTGIIEACLGHDLEEDTLVTSEQLSELFDPRIVKLVEELTFPSSRMPIESPRKDKLKVDFEHLAKVSDCAKMIKMADRFDNIKDIERTGHKYATKYLGEARTIHEICGHAHKGLAKALMDRILEKEKLINGK